MNSPFGLGRLGNCLDSERCFWTCFATMVGFLAFMKGIRPPGTWAATQAQVDYSHGFVKRGLFGEVVGRPFHLAHYSHFVVVSFLLLAMFVAAIVLLMREANTTLRIGAPFVPALFWGSFAFSYIAHLNGYMDILLGIMTAGLLLVRSPFRRIAAAIPAAAVALLIHEIFLLAFVPVVLLTFAFDWARANDLSTRRLIALCAVMLVLVAAGVTAALSSHRPLSIDEAREMQQEITARSDFAVRTDFFDVYTRSVTDNLRTMWGWAHKKTWWRQNADGVLTLLPGFVLLMALLRRLIYANHHGPQAHWLWTGSLAAALAPLSLNLLGWDVGRWYALAGLTALLVVLSACSLLEGENLKLSPRWGRAALFVIALNLAAGEGLMDRETPHMFPYLETIRDWSASVKADHPTVFTDGSRKN